MALECRAEPALSMKPTHSAMWWRRATTCTASISGPSASHPTMGSVVRVIGKGLEALPEGFSYHREVSGDVCFEASSRPCRFSPTWPALLGSASSSTRIVRGYSPVAGSRPTLGVGALSHTRPASSDTTGRPSAVGLPTCHGTLRFRRATRGENHQHRHRGQHGPDAIRDSIAEAMATAPQAPTTNEGHALADSTHAMPSPDDCAAGLTRTTH